MRSISGLVRPRTGTISLLGNVLMRQFAADAGALETVMFRDGFLTEADKKSLSEMDALYRQAMVSFSILNTAGADSERRKEEKVLIELYNDMGALMKEFGAADAIMLDGGGSTTMAGISPACPISSSKNMVTRMVLAAADM